MSSRLDVASGLLSLRGIPSYGASTTPLAAGTPGDLLPADSMLPLLTWPVTTPPR